MEVIVGVCRWDNAGPSCCQVAYVPNTSDARFVALLSVGDSAANGFRMVGIPDGLGACNSGDATFVVLMNHEDWPADGAVCAHGPKGAFV